MDDELRDLHNEENKSVDEYTVADFMETWDMSRGRTARKLARLVDVGTLATRKAYDPRVKKQVNAYKRVE